MTHITTSYPVQRFDSSKSIFNTFPSKRNVGLNYYVNNYSLKKEKNDNNNLIKTNSNKKALVASAIGCGMLFLSKGAQKRAKQSLIKIKDHLETKLDASILEENNKKMSFYDFSIRKINSFLEKAESINNINSLKDVLFMNVMNKVKLTKNIHKSISGFFEKLSINTVKKSYKKTAKTFNKMYKTFDDLDNYIMKTSGDEIIEYKGEKIPKKELVKKAKDYRENVKIVVNAFIMDETQNARYNCIKQATSKLYSGFWDKSFKGFWTKDNKFKRKEMWQTFIAAEQIKGNKTSLAENVTFARNMLSYTEEEKAVFLSGYLDNINSIISVSDAEGAKIMKRLKWFVKNPSVLKDNKDIFLKELKKLDEHKITNNENLLKDKNTNIRLIKNMVNDNGTGELQDMLDIYSRIAPFELSNSGALKSAKKAVKSFDKSVHLEIGEFFDKARDLELGSAPTDILTILISCGMITYGIDRAKGKDEKTSVILKSGIPIVGAVATSLISATKLISGGKSIALGFVSGVVLNRIGKYADDYRKNIKNNKH